MDMILNGNYLQQHRVVRIQQRQQHIKPAPSKCGFEVMCLMFDMRCNFYYESYLKKDSNEKAPRNFEGLFVI
jgi:hypothetical protein